MDYANSAKIASRKNDFKIYKQSGGTDLTFKQFCAQEDAKWSAEYNREDTSFNVGDAMIALHKSGMI